jgi:hypothetical protein
MASPSETIVNRSANTETVMTHYSWCSHWSLKQLKQIYKKTKRVIPVEIFIKKAMLY